MISMSKNKSFLVKLLGLYAVLAAVLEIGFDLDIFSWWAMPAYETLAAVVRHVQEFFQLA